MSNALILLNGLPGAGKTTTGRLLHHVLQPSMLVDFDALTAVNPFEVNNALFRFGLRNAAYLIENAFVSGYRHVLVCGGCMNQAHTDYLLNLVTQPHRAFWFWLEASKQERQARKLGRSRDSSDQAAAFEFVDARMSPFAGTVQGHGLIAHKIETDGCNPQTTVARILSNLHSHDVRRDGDRE
jgi:shikimate kinase